MVVRSPIITVMTNAAFKARPGLVRDFGEVENLQVSEKGPADFVTAGDLRAEKVLHAELKRARPTYGLLLEEGGTFEGSDNSRRWIVDPLDGTLNFLHGIPHFAISIGLEHDGEIIAGVIYDPLRDELFHAEKGGGAYLNDRRLRVSSRSRIDHAVVATGIPWSGRTKHVEYLDQIATVMTRCAGIRRMGSAALDLAYVAAGRYEGFWEPSLSPWDIAAGILLVREAGGLVSEIDGGDDVLASGNVLATNERLNEALRALIASPRAG